MISLESKDENKDEKGTLTNIQVEWEDVVWNWKGLKSKLIMIEWWWKSDWLECEKEKNRVRRVEKKEWEKKEKTYFKDKIQDRVEGGGFFSAESAKDIGRRRLERDERPGKRSVGVCDVEDIKGRLLRGRSSVIMRDYQVLSSVFFLCAIVFEFVLVCSSAC